MSEVLVTTDAILCFRSRLTALSIDMTKDPEENTKEVNLPRHHNMQKAMDACGRDETRHRQNHLDKTSIAKPEWQARVKDGEGKINNT